MNHQIVSQRAIWSLVGLSLCFLALNLGLFQARAFAVGCPWGSDHWFNVTVTIDRSSLPAGVTTEEVTDYAGNTQVYLTNSTNIPLLINPPNPNKTYAEPYPRPLTMKLVSGEGYYCDVQSKPMKCKMNSRINKANAQLDTPEISKAVLTGWVVKDDRPLDVKIPRPESFEFNAMYGDKQITIKGRVSFLLNNKYDPKLGIKSKELCDRQAGPKRE